MAAGTWRDTRHCVVLTGTLAEPYTGTRVSWTKKKATTIQIDYVVALGNAWTHGAQRLAAAQRTALANDPGNLIAADGPANEAKGDSTDAAWMPKNKGAWCSYSTKYVLTVDTYHLWVSQADQQMLQRGLATCAA